MTATATAHGFDVAVAIVLLLEGVDSDPAADRGGRTRYGISIWTWRRHLVLTGRARTTSIETLDLATAAAIYRRDYWNAGWCEHMEWPLSLVHFDSMVQHRKAASLLQDVVGAVPDGIIGPRTLEAVNALDPSDVAEDLLWRRLYYYRALLLADDSQHAFAEGWMGRLYDLRGFAFGRRELPRPLTATDRRA